MLKPLLTLTLLISLLYSASAQQLQVNQVKIINDITPTQPSSFPTQSGAKGASCGVDTLFYTYYKTTNSFQAVSLNAATSGNGFAQWYPAPQAITVTGFDFYAWQSAGTGALVNVTCNLYLAQGDSFPFASPARSVTISIDSTFGNGNLSALRRHARFSMPITISVPYVVTIETSSNTNISVICNNYQANNGRSEWLSSVRIQNNWFRSYNINVGGTPFNADFILQPTVSYELSADFDFTGCNEGNTPFTFTNTSSPVMMNKFYNRYAYYNIGQFGFQWDYGDNSAKQTALDGSKTYYQRQPYLVTLRDTFYGWTVGCSDIKSKLVPFTPLPPNVSNDGPHCSGAEVKFSADSIWDGVQYLWSGPKGFTSQLQNPSIPVADTSHNGRYYLHVRFATCFGNATSTDLVIHQTPQKPTVSNDGPKCIGDNLTISAQSPSPNIEYHWSGPNSFSHQGNQYTFISVDTFKVGTYHVYVADSNCTSETDSTDIYTYPPPAVPELEIISSDSICQGDSLYLHGNSVFSALFEWIGPNGFSSSATSPALLMMDSLQSGYYSARVIIGSCVSEWDSIYAHVNRRAITPIITGSDTSTEGLVKTYLAPKDPRDAFIWTCSGGTILGLDSASGAIEIEWGVPGAGELTVVSFSEASCYGEIDSFFVQILAKPMPPEDTTGNTGVTNTAKDLKVYPNPSQKGIFVQLPIEIQDFQFEIFSFDGKRIKAGNAVNQGPIELLDLNEGHYIIRISAEKVQYSIRFTKTE